MSDDMALIENHELAEDFWANLARDVREGLIFLVQGFLKTKKSSLFVIFGMMVRREKLNSLME